jgi:hypothetical protein
MFGFMADAGMERPEQVTSCLCRGDRFKREHDGVYRELMSGNSPSRKCHDIRLGWNEGSIFMALHPTSF